MLREIEEALGRRGGWTLAELATSLGLPPALVRSGIGHLVRLGRLPPGSLGQIGPCAEERGCLACGLPCGAMRGQAR
jgi:hypothetical protein